MTPGLRRAAIVFGLGLGLSVASPAWADTTVETAGTPPPPPVAAANATTADHSKYEILQEDFASGPEVTEACLSCHTEADNQLMHSIHFQWAYQSNSGQTLGKRNVINAFCGSVASNEPRCTSCHAGEGWANSDRGSGI